MCQMSYIIYSVAKFTERESHIFFTFLVKVTETVIDDISEYWNVIFILSFFRCVLHFAGKDANILIQFDRSHPYVL